MKHIYIVMGHNTEAGYSYPVACFKEEALAHEFMIDFARCDNANEFDTMWVHKAIILN